MNIGLGTSSLKTRIVEAGDGQCPSAQVLRNSLSGHPPSPATTLIIDRCSS